MASKHSHILKLLGVESTEEALVQLYEAVGGLVLCIHWLRGTFNWMMHTGAVEWPSEEARDNYERLFKTIQLYERFIWEVAPSRAALVGMRDLRHNNGTITLADLSQLLVQGAQGRIPFDLSEEELDDINDLLRRLGEARVASQKGHTHDQTTKRAYATIHQQGLDENG